MVSGSGPYISKLQACDFQKFVNPGYHDQFPLFTSKSRWSDGTNPTPWFEIYVEDMKRARKFYEGLLGVELNLEDMPGGEMEMYLFPGEMSLPRAAGALIKHPMRKPNEQGHLLYFPVPDCAKTAEWAAEAGVPLFVEKQSIGEHGFIAIIGDSEGNAVGLHSWV